MTASSKAYFATPRGRSVAANFDPRKRVTACPQSPRPFSYVLSCNARCCVSILPGVIDGRNLGGTRAIGRRNGSEGEQKMPFDGLTSRLNIRLRPFDLAKEISAGRARYPCPRDL